MFSVEMDYDEIKIVVIDDYGLADDLEIKIYEDCVFLKQVVMDPHDGYEQEIEIMITPDMFDEMRTSFEKSNGVYQVVSKRKIQQ